MIYQELINVISFRFLCNKYSIPRYAFFQNQSIGPMKLAIYIISIFFFITTIVQIYMIYKIPDVVHTYIWKIVSFSLCLCLWYISWWSTQVSWIYTSSNFRHILFCRECKLYYEICCDRIMSSCIFWGQHCPRLGAGTDNLHCIYWMNGEFATKKMFYEIHVCCSRIMSNYVSFEVIIALGFRARNSHCISWIALIHFISLAIFSF